MIGLYLRAPTIMPPTFDPPITAYQALDRTLSA